jgi:malate dehydrogenase (oxaloacetate-decarboxylating)(NADP+)
MLDVGTNTEDILNDPAYIGVRQKRDRSSAYDDLIHEFIISAQQLYGRTVLIQVRLFIDGLALSFLYLLFSFLLCFIHLLV